MLAHGLVNGGYKQGYRGSIGLCCHQLQHLGPSCEVNNILVPVVISAYCKDHKDQERSQPEKLLLKRGFADYGLHQQTNVQEIKRQEKIEWEISGLYAFLYHVKTKLFKPDPEFQVFTNAFSSNQQALTFNQHFLLCHQCLLPYSSH